MNAKLLASLPLLLASTAARADQQGPFIHVENEVGTHVSVVRVDGERATACVAPCDQSIPPGTYRLSSESFRPSNVFHVASSARKVDVRIDGTTRGKLTTAIVLMTVSGAFATAGLSGIGYVASRGFFDMGLALGLSIPMFTMSVATGIPGVVLLGKAIESKATVIESDRPTPPPSAHRPGFMVPLVSGSF